MPRWVASAKFPRKWATLFDHRAAFVNVPRLGEQPTPVRITLPDSRVVSSEEEGLDRILSADLGRDVTLAKTAPQAPRLEEYWPDIQELDSTKLRAAQSLHDSQCGSLSVALSSVSPRRTDGHPGASPWRPVKS